ncbi:hypothetical protein C0995_016482 [Termitomyces sp. Mi166|nr:hypothetical protein C0995_016482 [Termitomyces sp. Mi166\
MERRSKRLRTASKPNYSVDIDIDIDSDAADPALKKGTKVKKKSSVKAGESKPRRVVRGRRGKLEQISQLSLDVLFEIFSQLDPIDILNLSRTSKTLRNILMRRSSLYVWKNARARVDGLPECPDNMSEPAFVSLPYDEDITKNMIPTCTLSVNNNRIHDTFVNADTLRQYQAEKRDLKGSALDEWRALKCSHYEARKKHADECELWNADRNSERVIELDNLREQRYQASVLISLLVHYNDWDPSLYSIQERLSDLGWSEEVAYLEDNAWEYDEMELSEHKLVKQPKVLTERIWNNIKGTLIDFLEGAKARRLTRSYRQTIKRRGDVLAKVLETYASSQPLHAIFPSVADVAVLSAFRVVIENTPLEEEVLELHYQQAMVDFPQIVTEWRHSKDETLITMINDHPDMQEIATLATLRQAGIFFLCRRCRKKLSYPRVLIHQCATNCWPNGGLDEYFRSLGCQPWNHENSVIRYDHLTSNKAKLILHDCQLDDETDDVLSEFTKSGLRFECRLCESHEGRLIMRWPIVIDHITGHHREDVTTDCTGVIQLADLTSAEKVLAGMLEYVRMSPASQAWCHNKCWVCIECKKSIPWSYSLEHYKQKHPGVLPADYTKLDHKCNPDRYLAIHLDASSLFTLCAPIKVNVHNPVHGFRDALLPYRHRYSSVRLDMIAQQMADIFSTK